MVENVEKRRGRRSRWLVLAALLAVGAWVVRSRQAARADVGTGWPPPRPADAGAEWLVPEEPTGRTNGASAPVAPGPSAVAAVPPPPPPPPPPPATAPRRPSPRPRAAAPAAPSAPLRQEREDPAPPGAAASLPDGSAPGSEYTIKGKTGSMLFHPPGSPYYARTKAEYWFRTAEDARAAGFTEWTPRRR
jgi:hypothetical protein